MPTILGRALVTWLPLAFIATMAAMLGYVETQQALRQSAYDPGIQMAEDAAAALNAGAAPATVVMGNTSDISQSLAPFIIVYDASHKPLESTGKLNGVVPVPPTGVFDYVDGTSRDGGAYSLRKGDQSGEERLTWQPAPGTRIATVVTKYKDGYVLAGRNMREVEGRIENAGALALMAWILAVGGTFVWSLLIAIFERKN